ncbi:hypothetical protein C0992_010934 [Termitomyces sp. T32_za158]|nr:hypothetical protein C0992_010934 [Termitomyces sp. T32_za158]
MRGFKLKALGILAITSSFILASDLRANLAASAIGASFPGDASYTSSSAAYNERFSFKPVAIVYPKTPQDVSEIIKIGASHNLKVAARSGGHSYIANGLGGRNGSLVVDLKKLSRISVNSAQGTAVIETGNRLGDVATVLANNGKAIPHGTCAYVGIGGHAAARGISAFQKFVQTDIPSKLGAEIVLGKGSTSGTVYFALSGGWYGNPQDLNSILSPFLRQMPPKPSTSIKRGSYIAGVTELAGGSLDTRSAPDSRDTFYAKSIMTPAKSPMSETAIQAFTRYLAVTGFSSNTEWFIEIALYGGKNSAINAVASDATAFGHRNSLFTFQLYASSPGSRPPFPQSGFGFVDGAVNSIVSNSPSDWPYGAYINYVDDRLVDWKSRYYGVHYGRLQALKAKYDPHNLFDFPTGITK